MTREEAENLLDDYIDKLETMTDYVNREDYIVWTQVTEDKAISEYTQLKEKLIKALKQESKWIPVSEQSPKESGKYFVTFRGTYLVGEDFYTTEDEAREIFEEPKEHIGWSSHNVVAWMPMPLPYKAESEG